MGRGEGKRRVGTRLGKGNKRVAEGGGEGERERGGRAKEKGREKGGGEQGSREGEGGIKAHNLQLTLASQNSRVLFMCGLVSCLAISSQPQKGGRLPLVAMCSQCICVLLLGDVHEERTNKPQWSCVHLEPRLSLHCSQAVKGNMAASPIGTLGIQLAHDPRNNCDVQVASSLPL